MTSTALKKRSEQKYIAIYLDSLRVDSVLDFDLYINVNNQLVLYRAADLPFTERTRMKLLENKVERIYITNENRQNYQRYIEKNLNRILTDKAIEEAENKIKDASFADGAKHENERIQGIESLQDSDNKEIIAKHKYNMEMTKEDVAVEILDSQKKKSKKAADDIEADAKELSEKDIHASDTNVSDEERQSAAKNMANAMNQKRGLK